MLVGAVLQATSKSNKEIWRDAPVILFISLHSLSQSFNR
jgi:hypothetical protein